MLNRFIGPFFGKKVRGKLMVNPGYAIVGSVVYIDVEEFDPVSIVAISCFAPSQKQPFFIDKYYINENGSIATGEVKISILENFPTGEYIVVAEGVANKDNKTISMKFIVK